MGLPPFRESVVALSCLSFPPQVTISVCAFHSPNSVPSPPAPENICLALDRVWAVVIITEVSVPPQYARPPFPANTTSNSLRGGFLVIPSRESRSYRPFALWCPLFRPLRKIKFIFPPPDPFREGECLWAGVPACPV